MRLKEFVRASWACSLFSFALLLIPFASHALDVKRQALPNGLTVMQVERHNLPVVMVTLLVKASPLNEPADKAGMAYLTAKMLTEGTVTRKALDISSEIEFIGASLDATTGSDFTTISLSVLKKDVEKGFELFADILLHPAFPEDELKRRKDLIKGSLRQREEEPSFLAEKRFIKEVFGDQPYGRLVEGTVETIDGLQREDLVHFYRKFYAPEEAILSVVGDLSPQELDSLLTGFLGKWKQQEAVEGATAKPQPATAPSPRSDGKGPTVVIINRDITQANIVLGNKGLSREDPDYYAVTVMNYILGGGGFASRLMKIVRDEMGLAYSIYSSFTPTKEPGYFEVEVQTKNESAATVIREIVKQMERMKREPVPPNELKDAKSFLTGSFPRRVETTRKIADFLTAVQFFNLGDDYIEKYPSYIDKVTSEDVMRVARKYLDTESYTLVVAGNESRMRLADLQPLKDVK